MRLLRGPLAAGVLRGAPLGPSRAWLNPHRAFRVAPPSRQAAAAPAEADADAPPPPPAGHVFPTTGLLWISGALPLTLSRFDIRHWFVPRNRRHLREFALDSVTPKSIFPKAYEVLNVIPAPKEGGMVLKYGYDGSAAEAETVISDHLRKTHVRTWYNWNDLKAFPILGTPFIEDLLERHPSHWLKVTFQGPPLSVEELFTTFRPYGRINDIVPAADGKSATVIFVSPKDGVTAQNCLLKHKVGCTVLDIEYVDPAIVGKWVEWFQKNTRLAVLILGAIVAVISFAILEPTREFLIANKITKQYTPKGLVKLLYRLTGRAQKAAAAVKPVATPGVDLASDGLEEVREYSERLIENCKSPPDTFFFVVGPKGSGKNQLMKAMTDMTPYDLTIDLDEIQAQGTDALVLRSLTRQIGYWPQFTFFSKFGAMADALIVATTGTSAGLASTPQQDFKGFLNTATLALKRIVKRQNEANAKLASSGKPTKVVDYPVVVVWSFASKERAKGKNAWTNDLIAEWAATLVENKIANVVFVSKNPMSVRTAARFLPTKTFEVFTLHDAPYQQAYNYIKGQLLAPAPPPAEDGAADAPAPAPVPVIDSIEPAVVNRVLRGLGGRLTDLEVLTSKIKAATMVANEKGQFSTITTQLVQECYDDLVTKVISEVRKAGFGDNPDEAAKLPWKASQFWHIVKVLADNETASYDDVKNSGAFAGNDAPLMALEDAEIIALEYDKGRPYEIRVGRPIAREAFKQMVHNDPKFAAAMNVKAIDETIKTLTDTFITPAEAELEKLNNIINGPGGNGGLVSYMGWENRKNVAERVKQLSGSIGSNTEAIRKLSEEKAKWLKQMATGVVQE
ncbi:RNA12 protein-domain-containing protein [Hyaloraphidium curvatum]|nr:RNA12 protein-domain-containing protein [Hyaloraphidium curvatum]